MSGQPGTQTSFSEVSNRIQYLLQAELDTVLNAVELLLLKDLGEAGSHSSHMSDVSVMVEQEGDMILRSGVQRNGRPLVQMTYSVGSTYYEEMRSLFLKKLQIEEDRLAVLHEIAEMRLKGITVDMLLYSWPEVLYFVGGEYPQFYMPDHRWSHLRPSRRFKLIMKRYMPCCQPY